MIKKKRLNTNKIPQYEQNESECQYDETDYKLDD